MFKHMRDKKITIWQLNDNSDGNKIKREREIYSIVFISFSFKYMAVVITTSVFSLYEEVKEKADKNIDEQYKK